MSSVGRTVFLISVFIQVVQSSCGGKGKSNKEEDDDCWYQLWYFWLIVGLFLTGAAVIVFFYCQQYAKNSRLERRGRRRNHQMVLPPAPPSYEEPGHQPPPYHIALTESTVPDGHREVFHHPYQNRMELQEVTEINENGSEIRPQSVPPPYSLIDHHNSNRNNNSNSSYFQAVSLQNAGGNSLLQLQTPNLSSYTYNSPTSTAPGNVINSVSNHRAIYPYCNSSGVAVGQLPSADNVFHSNIRDTRISAQLISTPMHHQFRIHQYSELPPYESRPQSGVQGPNRETGVNVSLIESSVTTTIAVLTGHQILGVHNSPCPNANTNTDTNGRERSAPTCNRQGPLSRSGTNAVAPHQHRRVSLPQARSNNRNVPIRGRRSLSSETDVGPTPNSNISQLNSVRQSQKGRNSTVNQTAKAGVSQAENTPRSTTSSNETPRSTTTTNVTPRSTIIGAVTNSSWNSTNSIRRTRTTQSQRQFTTSRIQWSRRLSEQGKRQSQGQ